MADVLTEKQRKYNMSQIKSKNTKPELVLRKLLSENKIKGYRLHKNIPGKPDLVFTKRKLAIFIDGCFWHKCPKCFIKPETRTDFWLKKITGNVKRDKEITYKLQEQGWKILRFWEHQLEKTPSRVISKIQNSLG